MGLKRAVDELRRRIPAGIEVQRTHERLIDVLERRVKAARAGTGLGGAKDDDVVDAQLVRNLGQRGTRNKRYLQTRELAFIELGIRLKERTATTAPRMESPKNSSRS